MLKVIETYNIKNYSNPEKHVLASIKTKGKKITVSLSMIAEAWGFDISQVVKVLSNAFYTNFKLL